MNINDSKYLLNTKSIIKYEIHSKALFVETTCCTLEEATNNDNQCWIQNIALQYRFVSLWSLMCMTAGSLQINACTILPFMQCYKQNSSILEF